MLAVKCPEVTTGRGEWLVDERSIVAMRSTPGGFVLTVLCPLGHRHEVRPGRLRAAA